MNIENEKDNTNLKKAIVETVAFFDLFDYPLTFFEIWKYLSCKCNLSAIRQFAHDDGLLEEKKGFYFLKGRSEIVRTRMARYNYANRKFKRALRVARFFKLVPWIKMVAIGNLIGANNMNDGSDIDLFVITEEKRIWLTRFFCASFMKFFGLRPTADNARDKICLSFFISEGSMDLENLMMNKELDSQSENQLPNRAVDVYFIYWLAGLSPIYDASGNYDKFTERNIWIKKYLPNWEKPSPVSRRILRGKIFKLYYYFADMFLGWAEKYFKALQLWLMPVRTKEIMNKNTNVVISDDIIKLHVNDRRDEYRIKWKNKINNFLSPR